MPSATSQRWPAPGAGQGAAGRRRHRAGACARALSVLDALEVRRSMHSWPAWTPACAASPARQGRGRAAELRRERRSSCWRSLKARPGQPRRPSAAAWTCAPTAWARRSCANAACTHEADGQPPAHAQHGRATASKSPASSPELNPWLQHHQGTTMFGADKGKADRLDGTKLRIGIVQARFNESITDAGPGLPGRTGALGVCRSTSPMCRARRAGGAGGACRPWPKADEYDALIALGCIIRGETYHFELVANESGAGVTACAGLPVAHRQRHPHHREPGAGLGPPDRQGPRRRPRGRRDGQPAGRAAMSDACPKTAAGKAPASQTPKADPPACARRPSAQPLARVRAAGAVPAPGGRQRGRRHRPLHPRPERGFTSATRAHYDALLHGCIEQARTLDALLPCWTARWPRNSPMEHAIMWIGAYELKHCLDVPWRVVHQRMHRTGQGVWRHRRPQVRQRGAQRLAPRPARGRGGDADRPAGKARREAWPHEARPRLDASSRST
jgi:hypothetical protein